MLELTFVLFKEVTWLQWEVRTVHAPLYSTDLGWARSRKGKGGGRKPEGVPHPFPVLCPMLTPQSVPGTHACSKQPNKDPGISAAGPAPRHLAAASEG